MSRPTSRAPRVFARAYHPSPFPLQLPLLGPLSFLIFFLALTGARSGHAACGATACFLVTGTQEGLADPGQLRVDLSWRWLDQDRMREGSDETSHVVGPHVDFENGEIELEAHRELRTLASELRLDFNYGLSRRFTLTGLLPLHVERKHEHVEIAEVEHHGASLHALTHGPAEGTFENIDASGLGDLQIGVRYGAIINDDDLLAVGLSLKMPTGPHDLRDDSGAIIEPGLEPGTGGWGGVGSLHWSHTLTPHELDLFASGTLKIEGENDLDYRTAPELNAGVGLERKLSQRLRLSLQVNLKHNGRDSYRSEDVPATGSTNLQLTPGLRFEDASSSSAAYAFVQLPFYQHVNEEQLAPGPSLVIGVSRTF